MWVRRGRHIFSGGGCDRKRRRCPHPTDPYPEDFPTRLKAATPGDPPPDVAGLAEAGLNRPIRSAARQSGITRTRRCRLPALGWS